MSLLLGHTSDEKKKKRILTRTKLLTTPIPIFPTYSIKTAAEDKSADYDLEHSRIHCALVSERLAG